MTKREVVLNQIHLQEKLQQAGFNIVECGNCGTVLIHKTGDETTHCFCGEEMDLCDCSDLYYSGMENNKEFEEK
jgi:hypothetical protein